MHLPISILSNADPSMVKMDPFPHIILIDALPLEFATNLTNSFPKHLFDLTSNNQRLDISAINVVNSPDISQDWKQFIAYHSSKEFFKEVLSLFEHSLLANKNINLATLNNLNTGIRFQDTFDEKDCLLDAQISINTPVTKKSSVRKAHTDNNNKIFSGLFYLRQDDDKSSGGDLQICNWNDSYSYKKKLLTYKESLSPGHYTVFDEIPYANNVAVLFLNSLDALHCVTPRDLTGHTRTFVNLVGELPCDIFEKHTKTQKRLLRFKKDCVQKLKKLHQIILKVNNISILCMASISFFFSLNSGVRTPLASSTMNLDDPSSSTNKYVKSAI